MKVYKNMETFNVYTEEEMLDKHIGKHGTEARDKFEDNLDIFLRGEVLRKSRCKNEKSKV